MTADSERIGNRASLKSSGGGLSELQRAELARLESIRSPNQWSRGELSALRISARDGADQRRVEALTRKWAAQ